MNEFKVRITILNVLQRYMSLVVKNPVDFVSGLIFIGIFKYIIDKIFILNSFISIYFNVLLSVLIWEVAIVFIIIKYFANYSFINSIKKNGIKYLSVAILFSIYSIATASLMANLSKFNGSISLIIPIIGYMYFSNVIYICITDNDKYVFKKSANIIKNNIIYFVKYLIVSLLLMIAFLIILGSIIRAIFAADDIKYYLPIIGSIIYYIISPISFLFTELKRKEEVKIGTIIRTT